MEKLNVFRKSLSKKDLLQLKGGALYAGASGDKSKEKTKSKDYKGKTIDKCTSFD